MKSYPTTPATKAASPRIPLSHLLWAKTDLASGSTDSWLSLRQHLLDTAQVAATLGHSPFVSFAAGAHDIGKAHPQFQLRNDAVLHHRDRLTAEFSGQYGISMSRGAAVLPRRHEDDSAALVISFLIDRGLMSPSDKFRSLVAAVVAGHHGVIRQKAYLASWKAVGQLPGAYLQEVVYPLLDEIVAVTGLRREDVEAADHRRVLDFSGAVIICDWLASSMPLLPVSQVMRGADISAEVVCGNDLPVGLSRAQASEVAYERFPFEPMVWQRECAEVVEGAGLIVVESPTGTGKTEVALELASRVGNQKLFFCLPTRATATALHGRVDGWFEQTFDDRYTSARLIHGGADHWRQTLSLGLNVDGILHRRKGRLLYPRAVVTVDQVLALGMASRHGAIRHHALSGATVIMDECHEWGPEMEGYGRRCLQFLRDMGATVIAMSATLTARQRDWLHSSWSGGEVEYQGEIGYPMVSINRGGGTVEARSLTVDSRRERTVAVSMIPQDLDPLVAAVAEFESGACVIRVCSQVRQAQEEYERAREMVADPSQVMLIHSRYTAGDRAGKDQALIAALGPDADRPERMLVIATQVIQSSLDIDADVLITDLAPVSDIIQRSGRVHRHSRSGRVSKPRVYISDRSEFAAPIYGEAAIARTRQVFAEREAWAEPFDVPALVEAGDVGPVTDGSALWATDDMSETECAVLLNSQWAEHVALRESVGKRQFVPPTSPKSVWSVMRYYGEEDDSGEALVGGIGVRGEMRSVSVELADAGVVSIPESVMRRIARADKRNTTGSISFYRTAGLDLTHVPGFSYDGDTGLRTP